MAGIELETGVAELKADSMCFSSCEGKGVAYAAGYASRSKVASL